MEDGDDEDGKEMATQELEMLCWTNAGHRLREVKAEDVWSKLLIDALY